MPPDAEPVVPKEATSLSKSARCAIPGPRRGEVVQPAAAPGFDARTRLLLIEALSYELCC
jgi:hypothetical protein